LGQLIRWGTESARVSCLRSDGADAFLVPQGAPPSAEFVRRCLSVLSQQGFRRVVTGALSPAEQRGFLEAGFGVHEHLRLLVLDPRSGLPPLPEEPRLYRAGPARRRHLLTVDAIAFPTFWRLDRAGLRETLRATPQHRLRVALGPDRKVCGYAVSGASAGRGFVQRLAVSPSSQGRGIGMKLLLDGLYWLRSAGVYEVAVNTQLGNEAALALYHRVGFRDDFSGLSVLSAGLGSTQEG